MKVSECVGCKDFPCVDVKHKYYILPEEDVKLGDISIVMISDQTPPIITMLLETPYFNKPPFSLSMMLVWMSPPSRIYMTWESTSPQR